MTPHEVAEALAVSEHTLANWRVERTGPAYIRIGGLIRYDGVDLEEWLESRKRKTDDANQIEKRELVLSLLARPKRVHGKHRLGRHRTQQDRRDEIRSKGSGIGDERA